MFQTSHPYSSFHAAARCVSGGPIYITDEPGKHDINLIRQMTAVNPRGNTVILRPSTIGKSMHVYAGYEEERLLRVGTYNGPKATGTGIVGIFNVSRRPVLELIPLREFPGIEGDGAYVLRAHTTGEVSDTMRLGDKLALVSLDIAVKGWEILSAYPLRSFTLKDRQVATSVAVLGLLGKMTGAAAVVHSDIYVESTGRLRIWTSLKALGILGEVDWVALPALRTALMISRDLYLGLGNAVDRRPYDYHRRESGAHPHCQTLRYAEEGSRN